MNFHLFDQAIVDALTDLPIGGHVRPVGLAEVPATGSWSGEAGSSPFTPYLVVWPGDTDRDPQMLADPHAIYDGEWRINGVSTVPSQAKEFAGAAAAELIANPPVAPAGIRIVRLRHPGTRGPYPDTDVVPELYVASALVAIRIAKE